MLAGDITHVIHRDYSIVVSYLGWRLLSLGGCKFNLTVSSSWNVTYFELKIVHKWIFIIKAMNSKHLGYTKTD